MRLTFTDRAWEDYLWWVEHDRRQLRRVNSLLQAAKRTPFEGIGNPEPRVHELAGYWSRRIDDEHRLVYYVGDDELTVVQARGHY